MEIKNQSFANSLRCLQHPATILSIILLLLNEHILKIISPSWLTGKLSDFAGLFFFPFIVAAGLSVLLSKFYFKARHIGPLSFMLIALWFFLLKTSPFVNSLTSELASFVVKYPTQFILDWTDLIGLAAIIPAWRLWNQNQQWRQNRLAYVALSIGAFAAIATSPAMPTVESVTHLWMENDTVFAFDVTRSTMATSEDGGKTWAPKYDFDYAVFPNQYDSLPIVVCVPGHQNECYRVNGEEIVEFSEDAGKTWKISWELPANRIAYINRANPGINLGPHDLIIIQWSDQEYVLVAVGDEGILRKELPDGEWARITVENASPTPYQTISLSEAVSTTYREIIVWFLLSIVAFLVACWYVWRASSKTSPEMRRIDQWILFPALSPILGIFLAALGIWSTLSLLGLMGPLVAGLAQLIGFESLLQTVAIGGLVLCALGALALIPFTIYSSLKKWQLLLTKNGYLSETAKTVAWHAYLTHVSTFLTGGVIWIIWAMGVIARYDVALLINLISTSLVASIFYRKIKELAKQSIMESKTSEP